MRDGQFFFFSESFFLKNSKLCRQVIVLLTTGDVLDLDQTASIIPVQHKESTSVTISWKAPTDLKGNDPELIRYRVWYCTINTNCTVATPKSKLTSVVLKNLIPRHIYQFIIEVYNANNLMGPNSIYKYFFRTKATGKLTNTFSFHVIRGQFDQGI